MNKAQIVAAIMARPAETFVGSRVPRVGEVVGVRTHKARGVLAVIRMPSGKVAIMPIDAVREIVARTVK